MKNSIKNSKKMDLTDRISLEIGLCRGESFKEIARKLRRHPASISREIKNNRTFLQGNYPHGNDCRYIRSCNAQNICGNKACLKYCFMCRFYDCHKYCSQYSSTSCRKYENPPYVCNFCEDRKTCQNDKYFYSAKRANAVSDRRRSSSHTGIRIKGEEFEMLNNTLTKGIKKGQPISHICETYSEEIPVSERTLYNYISNGDVSVKPGDLRRQASYRKRKKKRGITEDAPIQQYRINRTYNDFLAFIDGKDDSIVTEMDTVKGKQGRGNVLLTMFMRRTGIMLIFLMPDCKQASVIRWFDFLEEGLGTERFKRLFKVFLTDNGSEFKAVDELELNSELLMRTQVFYCDAMASCQKGRIEKNHEYIRYVIPKGTDLNQYTEDDITLLMNHINSTRRKSLGGKCPYDLIKYDDADMIALMDLMKMEKIPAEEVMLSPKLLKIKR